MEKCYNKSKKENLDFLIFDSDIIFGDEELEKKYKCFEKNRDKNLEDKIEIGVDILDKLLKNKKYSCPPWMSFIKREYLELIGLKFYPGIIYEDELFTYQLYLNAQRVNYINKRFFKRRLRKNSTVTAPKGEKNMIGYMTVARELKKMLDLEKDNKKKKLIEIKLYDIVGYSVALLKYLNKDLEKKYKSEIKEMFKHYLNIKSKIQLDYPNLFEILKKIKEKVS